MFNISALSGFYRCFCLTLTEHFHVSYNLHDKCHMYTYSTHVYCILPNCKLTVRVLIGLLHSAQCILIVHDVLIGLLHSAQCILIVHDVLIGLLHSAQCILIVRDVFIGLLHSAQCILIVHDVLMVYSIVHNVY